MTAQPDTNDQLREAYERQRDVNQALVTKLSKQAFIDAGFPDPESTERKAIEKFGGDDLDFTDSDAIAAFAKDTLGYAPAEAPPEDNSDKEVVPHVDPANVVVADIRSDELDASADTTIVHTREDVAEVVNDLMKVAIAAGGGQEQIEAAMAAELQGLGFMPDQTYAGQPLST